MPTFPTLTRNPEFPLKQSNQVEVLKTKFEGGYVQTRQKYTRARGVWELHYSQMDNADHNSFSGFVNSVSGNALSFTWTHPVESQEYTVRFAEIPEVMNTNPGLWSTDFTLEEV